MRLCRYLADGQEGFGFYIDDQRILPLFVATEALGHDPVSASSLLELLPGGEQYSTLKQLEQQITPDIIDQHSWNSGEVQLLTPLAAPGKLLMLAGNYAQHVQEGGDQPESRDKTFPYLFLKPPNTFTNPGDPVRIPACSPDQIDWEIELGVVIGRRCFGVTEAEALNFVAGYTVVNDISDRGYRPNPERAKRPKDPFFDWQHGKWHDTFCPWGPCILPAEECPDPQSLKLELRVNDQVEQDGSTASMIFPVAAIIEFVSRFVTLQPGDVISTGTPAGVGKAKGRFLKPGDELSAQISGIGTLRNPVV